MADDFIDFCSDIVKQAIRKGADEAEAFLSSGRESEVSTRLNETETVKEAATRGLGIRVIKNKRLGFVYSTDFTKDHLGGLIDSAIELSAEATQDECNGLPEPASDKPSDLGLFDPRINKLDVDSKIDLCRRMEKRMFQYDSRITNSEGAHFLDGETNVTIVNSKGISGSYDSSYCYLYCVPVAQQDGRLQSGYWFAFSRFLDSLESPETVAEIAAARTVRMLGAGIQKTCRAPVVFDQLTGAAIIGSILAAIDGDAIHKRASFLVDQLNEVVASPLVTVRDDGRLRGGPGSAPFDGEGLPTGNKEIIKDGKLLTYLYDTYTAKKVGTRSTANAQRDYSSIPDIGGLNFYLQKGRHSPEEIIASVKNGFYVTNLMGFGLDNVTGDYSRGAAGLWIENGKITRPVEGITIASNILTMLKKIEMVGDDLKFMGPVSSPTFKISDMTIAGG